MNDPEIPVTRQKMKGMDVPVEENTDSDDSE